jgi:hypothetical protein
MDQSTASAPRRESGDLHISHVDGPARDRQVIALSDSLLRPYALTRDDAAAIASLLEGWIFDLIEIADAAAAKSSELAAKRAWLARHIATHPTCRSPRVCSTLGALLSNVQKLERETARELAALRRGER